MMPSHNAYALFDFARIRGTPFMKLWGIVVAGLYLAALLMFSVPLTMLAFWPKSTLSDASDMYLSWSYWVWIALMLLGELSLLFIPVHSFDKRPKSRRPLLVPILATGTLLGLLGSLGVLAITAGIWGDEVPDIPPIEGSQGPFSIGIALITLLTWTLWGFLFYRATRHDPPNALLRRATAWLLRGSVLELLVAVPCHVIVRRRNDCCAPGITFLGIATGLAVMLMSFGPGVFFLFVQRIRKLRPGDPSDATKRDVH